MHRRQRFTSTLIVIQSLTYAKQYNLLPACINLKLFYLFIYYISQGKSANPKSAGYRRKATPMIFVMIFVWHGGLSVR